MQVQSFMPSLMNDWEAYSKNNNSSNERKADIFQSLMNESVDDENTEAKVYTEMNVSAVADNGVKSAVFMARQLDSQQTKSTGATTVIKLTEEEKSQWKGENFPEGIRFCNAGGVMFTGGTKTFDPQTGVFYTSGDDYDYQFAALYDENSPEDNPVIYLQMSAVTTNSPHYKDFIDCSEIVKVEVNKVDPANASYEEMIALAAYIYRDDPKAAREACDAVDMARFAMEADGLDWQNGTHDYTSYYLPEVVRRNRDSTNPANQALAKAAEPLLEYLKDYPRVKTENA